MKEETGKTKSHVGIVEKELQNEAAACIERVKDKNFKETGKTARHAGIVEKELQNEAKAGRSK